MFYYAVMAARQNYTVEYIHSHSNASTKKRFPTTLSHMSTEWLDLDMARSDLPETVLVYVGVIG